MVFLAVQEEKMRTMKKYLLLRDNRQSGPFFLEELRDLNLVSKDLVWVEGESNCWSYPTEMEELKDSVVAEKKRQPKVYVALPKTHSEKAGYSTGNSTSPLPLKPISEEKESVPSPATQEYGIWRSKKLSSFSNIASIAAVFSGLVLGAFLMKKAVDGYEKPMAVESIPLTVIPEQQEQATPPVQNALLTEIIQAKENHVTTTPPAKPKDLKKQLSIKASDYSVGVFGGISNLQLKVFNGSSHRLDKITLAIQYLKPNGSVIETAFYEMYSIKPNSMGSLSIPDSKRGTKIKYRIVDVSSKEIREI